MKLKTVAKLSACAVAVLTSTSSFSRSTPNGFESFFTESLETVNVVVAGVTFSQSISALVSYESFQLPQAHAEQMAQYLTNNRIRKDEVESVVAKLTQGISFKPDCVEACIAQDIEGLSKGKADYLFDYDNKTLTIFASSEMFDFETKEEFHSPFRQSNALINATNLYAFSSGETNNLVWSNDTTLGLPYGYLNFDTQYNHQDDDLNVFTGVYALDLSGHQVVAGYTQLGSRFSGMNTTDFLTYGADYSGYSVSVGSSDNLLKGDKAVRQTLNFYTPHAGQLELYREGKLIHTQVVRQGQNAISYSELPKGVYTLTMVVKQGETELVNETRSIVNNGDTSLLTGEFDYRLRVGSLDDENDNEGGEYLEGYLSHRLSENAMIGGSLTSDFDTHLLRLGGRYHFNDTTRVQYMGGVFDSGALYQQASFSMGALGFNVRHVDVASDEDGLSRTLYGEHDITEFGMSYSATVAGGSAFVNFYRLDMTNDEFESQSDNVSLSWSRSAFGGRLGLNSTYSMYEDKDDSLTVGINWRYEFSDALSFSSSVTAREDGFDYAQQQVTLRQTSADHDMSVTVGAKVTEGDLINEISTQGSGSNDYVRYNAYGFYNTDDTYSVSGTLKSTQVVTTDDITITSESGRSFVKVSPEWTSQASNSRNEISYSIYKDGKRNYGGTVGSNEEFMVPLPVYSDVRFELDTEYSDVEVSVKSRDSFTTPGTYYQMNNEVTPLSSQLFLLNDIDGNSVETAQCAGEGCKSVNDITSGVYRVTYRQEQAFHLISDDRICVFNPEHFGDKYVNSYCLEGLNDIDESSAIVYNDMKYIGVYQSTEATLKIIERLEELGLASRFVAVGNQLYVYVRYDSDFTVAQLQTLQQLETHLVSTKFTPETLFNVTSL